MCQDDSDIHTHFVADFGLFPPFPFVSRSKSFAGDPLKHHLASSELKVGAMLMGNLMLLHGICFKDIATYFYNYVHTYLLAYDLG